MEIPHFDCRKALYLYLAPFDMSENTASIFVKFDTKEVYEAMNCPKKWQGYSKSRPMELNVDGLACNSTRLSILTRATLSERLYKELSEEANLDADYHQTDVSTLREVLLPLRVKLQQFADYLKE